MWLFTAFGFGLAECDGGKDNALQNVKKYFHGGLCLPVVEAVLMFQNLDPLFQSFEISKQLKRADTE